VSLCEQFQLTYFGWRLIKWNFCCRLARGRVHCRVLPGVRFFAVVADDQSPIENPRPNSDSGPRQGRVLRRFVQPARPRRVLGLRRSPHGVHQDPGRAGGQQGLLEVKPERFLAVRRYEMFFAGMSSPGSTTGSSACGWRGRRISPHSSS
jgi:hypothetical protein